MSNFTRRRGAAGAPQRGFFSDGVWHCDCSPRQPANHFEVKKQGPNQGKWFRTCQKQHDDRTRCKFFLWDSDAHPREAAALANNTRSEPANTVPKTPSKRPISPPPPYTTVPANGESSRKRIRAITVDSDDEYGCGANDEYFEDELDHVIAQVEIPREEARTSELATPSIRRTLPWNKDIAAVSGDVGLQTPRTTRDVQVDPFSSRLGKSLFTPTRQTDAARQIATPSSSPYETPTPHRFKDVGGDDLVNEVLTLLQDANVRLSTSTETNLNTLLLKHTKAAEGLRRGRDVTRTTIKARDAKIAELGCRVSTLEVELEAEKTMTKYLRWQTQTEQPSNP